MDIWFYLILFGAGFSAASGDQRIDFERIPEPPGIVAPSETPPEETPEEAPAPSDAAPGATLPSFGVPQPPAEAPAAEADAPDPGAGLVAEDQTPTGRMTTATEIRPILTATKPQWVAVREFDGKDLLYFTNLLAWRCGVLEIRYAVNGGPLTLFDAEPCHVDDATPNALTGDNIFVELPLGSLETLHVEVIYDDLGTDSADYDRAAIRMN